MNSSTQNFSDNRTMTVGDSCRPGSLIRLASGDPQQDSDGISPTWIGRGANFVVAVSEVIDGTVIHQRNIPDESMVLLTPPIPITVETSVGDAEINEEALAILPPGSAKLTAHAKGFVIRIFSNKAEPFAELAANAGEYSGEVADVAPLHPWPEPTGGYRLRVYRLADYSEDVGFGRIFRSSNLMVNIFPPSSGPRDLTQLSPHDHADFEQGSLTLEGDFIHYLRTPWGRDSTAWRADQQVNVSGCALMVIPPGLLHTTSWSTAGAKLVDIFAPPREDFSLRSHWVRNGEEYPLPSHLRS